MEDIFSDTAFGKAALKKLRPIPKNFMLFDCGWLGKKPEEMTVMKCTGAVFRKAKTGPNAGKLTVMEKGTQRTAYVTREEIAKFLGDEND